MCISVILDLDATESHKIAYPDGHCKSTIIATFRDQVYEHLKGELPAAFESVWTGI